VKTCTLLTIALLARPTLAQAQSASGDSAVYRLAPVSRFEVKTGKAGLLGAFGHEHLIRARGFSGRVVYYPNTPASSHLEITVPTESLEVLTPPDTAEIRKVTAAMRTEVLDVASHPEIRFASKTVTPTEEGFRIEAELVIVGRTRDVPVDVRATIGPDTLRATSTFSVKQTEFGIRPYRGGPAGTVKVADRVTFHIEAVAVREPGP
jgi:polyisoprenoid-binding protein YceI